MCATPCNRVSFESLAEEGNENIGDIDGHRDGGGRVAAVVNDAP